MLMILQRLLKRKSKLLPQPKSYRRFMPFQPPRHSQSLSSHHFRKSTLKLEAPFYIVLRHLRFCRLQKSPESGRRDACNRWPLAVSLSGSRKSTPGRARRHPPSPASAASHSVLTQVVSTVDEATTSSVPRRFVAALLALASTGPAHLLARSTLPLSRESTGQSLEGEQL